jgi:putative hydrolase of the HAD superfamily
MKRIAAVTFDLWDTLIQERPGGSDKVAKIRVAGICSALSSAGLSQGPEEIMTAHEKTGQFLGMVWAKSRDLSVTDQVLFMLTSIDAKLPGRLRPEDLRRIEKAYSESLLDSGYRIGLISNTGRTPGSTLRSVMERMDILEFFDTTTFSNEILVRKPAEGAFWTTLSALKAVARAAVHIGDDPESDIMGARRVGMKAIQILADGSRRSPEADFAVGSLEHLPAILDNL